MSDSAAYRPWRWRHWKTRRRLLVWTLRFARRLVALRIANHGTARCACEWCQLDRAAESVVAYVRGEARMSKIGKVNRWNALRSEIRHQGFGWWLLRLVRGHRVGW